MTAPYAVSTANTNKCPHGFPVGTCPICSGMAGGGASKDKNTPRKAGEMSYNECMAEWHRIQAQQKADLQEKIDAKNDFLVQFFSNKPIINLEKISQFQDKIIQNIEKLPQIIKTPVKFVVNVVHNVVNFALNTINNIQKFVVNFTLGLADFVRSVAEKLPMVLSEIKNFVSLNLSRLILVPTKTILTLFIGKKNKEDEDKKDKNRKKVKKILEKIFKLYFKDKDDNKQDKK